MSAALLDTIRDLIQQDVGNRGLARDPHDNLLTACRDNFTNACRSLAETPHPALAVVTGFWIPHATPSAAETDGPLGALFLARTLPVLGVKVALVTDILCRPALAAGLEACGLEKDVTLLTVPPPTFLSWPTYVQLDWRTFIREEPPLTHLVALERVGPSHTPASLQGQPGSTPEMLERFRREVPAEHQDRCHNMGGQDITDRTSPLHLLFEDAARLPPILTTIGIGDGGNEIGMGKLPWDVIRRNIPNGGRIACRVPVHHLIVAGVSNWGAYGLAAGVAVLRGQRLPSELFDVERERELLRIMVEKGPLVDGVTAKPTVTVDGLSFEEYAKPLGRLGELLRG
jgi:hypothetical protein